MTPHHLIRGTLVVAALALALRPTVVEACGGLFCNSAQPVNQAAERILFSENGDGSVTAVIEIKYEGPAESFSWVLPIPGVPKVEVSSVAAFDRLQGQTNPQYNLQTTSTCDSLNGAGGTTAIGTSGPPPAAMDPGVMVLAAGSVGPFDYEVIAVDPMLSDAAQVALDWLMTNGYDVTALGPEVLRPYLDGGLNLLAFRLTKTATTGSIRPIRITYQSDNPFIPIRPTAVAANDDMGIMVWVVGESRTIPTNYKTLELNEALINWFNPNSTYNDVVTAAADEAAGQGFVTEMAGASSALEGVIVQSWERDQWTQLQQMAFVDPLDLLEQVMSNFAGWDGVEDALRAAVTLPDTLSFEDFVGCPRCYATTMGVVIDETALLTQIWERVVKPMFDTEDLLLSRAYVTRLYTTMSADEMTMDPVFDFNADLEDVSNIHTAEQKTDCAGNWSVTLASGDVVYGDQSGTWPMNLGDLPANRKILQLTTSGQGETVEDNSDKIAGLLKDDAPPVTPGGGSGGTSAGIGAGVGGPTAGIDATTAGTSGSASDSHNVCGCRIPGGTDTDSTAGLAWLAGLALLIARRRRQ